MVDFDVERGMYGSHGAVRPAVGRGSAQSPDYCLRGHRLQIAGVTGRYSHYYRLTDITCEVCYALKDPLATWYLIDPTEQYSAEDADTMGLVLVLIPPAMRGGLGHIELWLGGVSVGDIDLRACGPCRRAVLEHVRVDEKYRRMGYGRVLVAAAVARAPGYSWSTTTMDTSLATRAFWAAVGDQVPGDIGGPPNYCTDMLRAAEHTP
ncbi:MAG: GNAT family N-acetyltransferase [Pseudonocardiaceae bacterium]|nr:GNAT family N-acetyltransferase [Pseudonocardiaceae bacterium]